jgi:hypothetical protein
MAMKRIDIAAVGARVAAYEDVTLWHLPRPSTSDRLAGVRRKQASLARRPSQSASSSRWGFALAASAAALLLLFFALHRRDEPASSRLGVSPGGIGATAAADVPPVSTAGCGGMEASGKTAGTAGSGG